MGVFLFKDLKSDELKEIETSLGNPEVVAKDGELYKSGFLCILIDGKARVCRKGGTGETVTIRNICSGEVFGAASVFGSWEQGFSSVIAGSSCTVIYLSEQRLKELFVKYPQISLNYIAFLSDRIRFLNRRIDAFTAGSTEQKLYEYLVSASDCSGVVKLGFGMSELARRLKMGRTSLYRGLDSLISSDLIERQNGQIKLQSPKI